MPSKVSSALRSRSTASCERRSRKQATSWRWPILAVVLGLFAHQEALAQTLESLTLTPSVSGLDPAFDSATLLYDADVLSEFTQVTAMASASESASVTYLDEDDADFDEPGYQRNLANGTNRIRVRVSATRIYTINVTWTTTPGAPRLRATPGNESVQLSWTAPSSDGGLDITGYQYRLKEEDADDYADDAWEPINPSDDLTTSHAVVDLDNGTTYLFQVRATNLNGGGDESNTAEATPAGPLPAPVVVADAGSRRVKLTWTHLVDGSVSGYQYQQRFVPGSRGGWRNIADRDLVVESGTTRSYTVTGLTNGRTYGFHVRGTNRLGGGAASREVQAMPEAGAPGAPANLTPTAGDEQVTLSWTAPSDNGGEPITEYEYRHTPFRDADDMVQPGYTAWIATGGTGTRVTVHGLDNGTTYTFQVRAVNDLGCTDDPNEREEGRCGQESLEVSAEPFGKPLTRVNLDKELVSDEDSRVKLTWKRELPLPLDADDLRVDAKIDSVFITWVRWCSSTWAGRCSV